jgi:hypothetical protein
MAAALKTIGKIKEKQAEPDAAGAIFGACFLNTYMIIFAVFLIALVGFLVYFFVFSGKKKAEGEDLNKKLGEHP